MTLLEKAQLLIKGAENAQAAGNQKASLELAIAAAQILQLVRLFEKHGDGVKHDETLRSI